MELGGKLFITLLLQFIKLSLADQNLVPVFISEKGSFLRTSVILHATEDSAFNCVQRCIQTLNCKSINYRRKGNGHNCFLNSKNRREAGEAAMIHDDKFIHYDIDYHTQTSEEAEFGPAGINMPTVPPLVAASPRPCDSNPCLNGGTCIENMGGNRFECNCTDTFTGDTCRQIKPAPGTPASQDDYDFELVYRSKSIANYVEYIFPNNFFNKLTVCTWIYTPDIDDNQKMTIWSLKEASNSDLRARILGGGGFSFSWNNQRTKHPNHFPEWDESGWVYLCVVIFKNGKNEQTVEAIVNANYSSKVSSTKITAPFQNVEITRLVIGKRLNNDGSSDVESLFEGRIADLNIWNWNLDEFHVDKWYRGTARNEPPTLAWNTLGYPDKRFGDVHFVSITSAFNGRVWRNIKVSELVINATSDVLAATAVDGSDEDFQVSISTTTTCTDVNTAPVVAAFIAVPGNWTRIKFQQTFKNTQHCYAIFGNVPTWAPSNFPDPGIEEFDPGKDEILKEKYLGGVGGHQYSGVNTLCGEEHFWAVNNRHPGGDESEAEISLRRKTGAQTAGISTYGKCGQFSFTIENIQVLEI